VAPLSFELLATLATGADAAAPADMRSQASRKESNVAPQGGPHGVRKQDRRTEIASAEAALRSAEQVLREAQANADNVASALEKAAALVNETEEGRKDAEERLAKARAAVNEARQRVHDLDVEAGKAKRVLRDAERSVERARSRLKQLGPI
jgi:chromosome segregation ATPase